MTEYQVSFLHGTAAAEEQYDCHVSQGRLQPYRLNDSNRLSGKALSERQHFKREGFCNYAVFELASESNELRMMLENKIPPFLPRELRYIDGFPSLYYHIEGRQTMALVYEKKKLDAASLRQMLQSLCSGLEQVREYLLSYDDFILDAGHVYWNWEHEVYEYIYLPGYEISIEEQLLRFVEYLLQHVDYQDVKAANLVYQMYEKLRKKGASIQLLYEFCMEGSDGDNAWENASMKLEARADIQTADASWQADSIDDVQDLYAPEPGWKQWIRKWCQAKPNFAVRKLFGGDSTGIFLAERKKKTGENSETVMPQGQEAMQAVYESAEPYRAMGQEKESATTLLKSDETALRLVSDIEGSPIIVPDEEKKIIGRQEQVCDFVLQATDVSRIHAGIVCKEGVLLVTDLNSSNGTFINGERIPIQEETILQKNDAISFASIRFHVE